MSLLARSDSTTPGATPGATPAETGEEAGADARGDQRRLPRAKIIKSGQIVFDDNKCLSECLVLDMSAGGAALQPSDTLNFPDRFQLRFKFGPTYDCEVCWQRGRKIGVRFLNDPQVGQAHP